MTNGVGVQPRGGVRSDERGELEKHREATASRGACDEVRGAERARRRIEDAGRMIKAARSNANLGG